MKQILWCITILLFFGSISFAACTQIADSGDPPTTLQESDLVGTWEANYGSYYGVDELVLEANGTFKQLYKNQKEGYVYETPWNRWSLEQAPDGRMRLYLNGARYYPGGIEEAEFYAANPWPFCDQFVKNDPNWARSDVSMVGRLVLNIRLLPSSELVLHHMSPSCGDAAFLDRDVFYKIAVPSQGKTHLR